MKCDVDGAFELLKPLFCKVTYHNASNAKSALNHYRPAKIIIHNQTQFVLVCMLLCKMIDRTVFDKMFAHSFIEDSLAAILARINESRLQRGHRIQIEMTTKLLLEDNEFILEAFLRLWAVYEHCYQKVSSTAVSQSDVGVGEGPAHQDFDWQKVRERLSRFQKIERLHYPRMQKAYQKVFGI